MGVQYGVPRSGLVAGVPRTRNLDLACAPVRLKSSDVLDLGFLDFAFHLRK